ncbi:S1C family serine protease [Dermabacter jinjuensis]|uniref:Peptidase n=1 Tax=Dermabacter jinjuensis TaxID=1667168 RepID=A0ABM6PM95_9MICO|nr:trypsin-like peptidase domain-containing protein [Dermabacter jinjuensis]ATH97103.1 peptidase [Dermabacter jinjuensis]UEB89267.1 trypsin-like peptidase domain-containing protein [Dermabacter jinjuensis]
MKKSPSWLATATLVIVGMLLSSIFTIGAITGLGLMFWGAPGEASHSKAQSKTAAERVGHGGDVVEDSWVDTARVISPSTVSIRVDTGNGGSEGTGIVYDGKGTIVTNAHVVAGAILINVTTSDGRTFDATLIGSDESTDIALVRLSNPPKDLTPATFADSSALTVGQDVMAMGTPLGLANTATTGIVSALNRPVVTRPERSENQDPSTASYTSAIQTDASVNPGNSGGPLVNRAGEVIGINSSIASNASKSEGAGSIGLGFAIPSNTVKLIAEQLAKNGKAKHAFLGVRIKDGEANTGSAVVQGAHVVDVTADSAAAKAGIANADLVTKVDDVQIGSSSALTAYVRSLEVGSTHTFTVLRDGKERTVDITLQGS